MRGCIKFSLAIGSRPLVMGGRNDVRSTPSLAKLRKKKLLSIVARLRYRSRRRSGPIGWTTVLEETRGSVVIPLGRNNSPRSIPPTTSLDGTFCSYWRTRCQETDSCVRFLESRPVFYITGTFSLQCHLKLKPNMKRNQDQRVHLVMGPLGEETH